ncbi:(2Fe-2S)-binding protein [Streptomyces lydicus]|nr:(2Fe-2S)-binding protein [Streptomyces lydicus]
MAAVHAPRPGWSDWLRTDTEVCRCEEVTAGRIQDAVTGLGARDGRTVKLLTRAGMGWCQGRMCGTAVTHLAGTRPPRPRAGRWPARSCSTTSPTAEAPSSAPQGDTA